MLTPELYNHAVAKAQEYLKKAGIVITEDEKAKMQVAEYGLNDLYTIGLELVVYVNTDRCCAKELVLLPGQTCPEHRHPTIGNDLGKEETFRCRYGKVYLYIPGSSAQSPKAIAPKSREPYFTVWHEIELNPGEQYTIMPDTLHWFQAGPDGAVISEFSTKSRDDEDIYTDPDINPVLKRTI